MTNTVTEKPCRVCGGGGFVAQKRCIDDGYGEVDSCPACDLRASATPSTLAGLVEQLYQLSQKWGREAHEIDQDGDFCCAHTRRNDAGELHDVLRRYEAALSAAPESAQTEKPK